MIKIISETPHSSVVKQCVCKNCGCTLEYTPNDISNAKSYDYTGGYDLVYYINCPKCVKVIYVKLYD